MVTIRNRPLTRVLARFEPLTDWRVIGPFPRTTPSVFVGEKSIDFARVFTGAGGRTVEWKPRNGDPATGRVDLESFNRNSGQTGDFGYDQNGSPDLSAFAFTELESPADRKVLMLLGSSGSLLVTVNEAMVYQYLNPDGRGYTADTEMVKLTLSKGRNRILVRSRQGIGRWAFGIQIADDPGLSTNSSAPDTANPLESLRAFALRNPGDPKRGEELFFEHRATACARCHSAAGRGTATIGPDLTGLASKYDRAEIIRSILEPSNRIATGYQSVNLATQDGKVITGVIRSESDQNLELATPEGTITQIPKHTIEDRRPSRTSLMPEGLATSLSTVEFADLISYLTTLKQPAQAEAHAQQTR